MKLNNKAGFSLVELMVVVAIIGILATVAIPNFTKFQAKAKQSSAKSELSGIYTAEKAFFTEYQIYHVNLPYIGYVPDAYATDNQGCPTGPTSTRYYRVGFGAEAGLAASQTNGRPTGAPTHLCTTVFGANRTWYSENNVVGIDPLEVGSTVDGTGIVFRAEARGNISNRVQDDMWFIDQTKALSNATSGI